MFVLLAGRVLLINLLVINVFILSGIAVTVRYVCLYILSEVAPGVRFLYFLVYCFYYLGET